jgi:hypothetical protein
MRVSAAPRERAQGTAPLTISRTARDQGVRRHRIRVIPGSVSGPSGETSVHLPSVPRSDTPRDALTSRAPGHRLRSSGLPLRQWAAQGATPCDRRPIDRAMNNPGVFTHRELRQEGFQWARGTTRRGK